MIQIVWSGSLHIFSIHISKRYFEKTFTVINVTFIDKDRNRQNWFDTDCRTRRERFKNAIAEFNRVKSNEARQLLYQARKDYKYNCRKKLEHDRERSSKMNSMRRKNPHAFWKMFKPNTYSNVGNELTLEMFRDHFKHLASETVIKDNTVLRYFFVSELYDNSSVTVIFTDLPIMSEEIKPVQQTISYINILKKL